MYYGLLMINSSIGAKALKVKSSKNIENELQKENITTKIGLLLSEFSRYTVLLLHSLCNMQKFHLISWYGNFVETFWKLCFSTKFPYQEVS